LLQGPIQLAFCETCGCIINLHFDPSRIEYSSNYENSLHFSSSFNRYAQSLARDLIGRHELREKVILEIGCGTGEFLSLLCRLADAEIGIGVPPLKDAIVNFQRNYQERVEEIRKALKPLRASKSAIFWGAGAKTVMFLNKFCAQQVCDYVVDINPHKQGGFIPGTGQEIVPPEFLKEYRPEVVIVMNPNYREEIGLHVERLDFNRASW
jgi:SAM-dependent methyltransferase